MCSTKNNAYILNLQYNLPIPSMQAAYIGSMLNVSNLCMILELEFFQSILTIHIDHINPTVETLTAPCYFLLSHFKNYDEQIVQPEMVASKGFYQKHYSS
jgi:hypothetical protein